MRLVELARDGSLLPSVEASVVRMLLGFVLSAAIGLTIGPGMGVSDTVNSGLRSLFLGLQTLPSAAWVPIALLLFGLGDAAIYFVTVMSSMAAMAIATADAIATIPPNYMRAARSLGTSEFAPSTRVALPAVLASITTGIRLGWTLGWHGVVSAELIKSSIGLGFLLRARSEPITDGKRQRVRMTQAPGRQGFLIRAALAPPRNRCQVPMISLSPATTCSTSSGDA